MTQINWTWGALRHNPLATTGEATDRRSNNEGAVPDFKIGASGSPAMQTGVNESA